MGLIRPAVLDRLNRWREVLAGLAIATTGLWWVSGPGPFLMALGGALAAVGAMMVIVGLRRVRFRVDTPAEGVVQIDEAQITYLSAHGGGFVALPEMTALALGPGATDWRLFSADGAVLVIPRGAFGAEALFDAFAALPGINMGSVMRTLAEPPAATRVVWRRDARAGLTIAHSRAT